MGTALVSGILEGIQNSKDEIKFALSVPSEKSLERLKQKFGSQTDKVDLITYDNLEAAQHAAVVIFAFQPQQLGHVLSQIGPKISWKEKLVVSLLAGVSIEKIADAMGTRSHARISRVIPSIGAQINESATLVAENPNLSVADQELVAWLFEQVGKTQLVPEQLISTVTAVSAATHALVVVATDAIVDGSVAQGVPRSMAQAVASQCLRGASTLLQGSMTIESLKESMSIERGITINALLELERGHVRSGISDAVRHAVRYAEGM